MFPLGSVLFPHTPLALRVFEPRYLMMLGSLLDASESEGEAEPVFGVVLISRGHEAGGGDIRTDLGTLARPVQLSVGGDDLQLLAVGGERFTVTRWLEDDPHPRAEIERLPAIVWEERLRPLFVEADAVVRRVLWSTGAGRWDADTELSDDPVEACWQLAALAPLGEYDRQQLLGATTTGALLRQIIDLTLDLEPVLKEFD